MTQHPFDCDFRVTSEQKSRFRRDGFVKLAGFLNANVLAVLNARVEDEMRLGTAYNFKVDALFSRAKYDFETDKNYVFELLERPYFRQVLTDLARTSHTVR